MSSVGGSERAWERYRANTISVGLGRQAVAYHVKFGCGWSIRRWKEQGGKVRGCDLCMSGY
jgi:hypothetical protein